MLSIKDTFPELFDVTGSKLKILSLKDPENAFCLNSIVVFVQKRPYIKII